MMKKKPKITVIMSVYNGERYVKEAIDSILNQTFKDFEFIITNDGSTDKSLELIQSYNDNRIIVINNKENIGLTKSLNNALKIARGEYIARQDADDVSLPNRFEVQINYFEENPQVVLLGTSAYLIDKYGKITGKQIVLAKPGDELLNGNQFYHGSTRFKKDVIDKLGGYNELFIYVQDYDLWLRIDKYYEVRNITKMLYKLRSHENSVGVTNIRESALYHLLALKLLKNELDEDVVMTISTDDIKSLCRHLTNDDKLFLHNTIAGVYVRNKNLNLARKEYTKIVKLNPFNIKNYMNIARSYMGTHAMVKTSKIYEFIINNITYIKNCWSK